MERSCAGSWIGSSTSSMETFPIRGWLMPIPLRLKTIEIPSSLFQTNYSYGYGFVNFVSEEGALQALKTLNGVSIRNKRLKVRDKWWLDQWRGLIDTFTSFQVSYARPSGEEIKDTNLYVTNLPRTINEDQLDVIFGKYGLIVQKNILRDKLTGKPRGVAFVRWVVWWYRLSFEKRRGEGRGREVWLMTLMQCSIFIFPNRFSKREEAQEAISALNNVIPEGGNQPLTVRVAEEHGKAKANIYYSNSPMNMNMSMMPNMNSMGYATNASNVMHRGRARVRFPNMCPYWEH